MIKKGVTLNMSNKSKKNTANEVFAEKEVNITPVQLLQEIEPLLKEYFIGDFEVKNNALNLSFKNGQYFKLKIFEVV